MRSSFAWLAGLGALAVLPSLVNAQPLPPRPPVPPPPRIHHVRIENVGPAHHQSRFVPPVVQIRHGEVVRWTSHSRHRHTVTGLPPFHGPAWGSGILHRGQSYSHRFLHVPGMRSTVYRYHCRLHPAMRGEVVVRR